MASSICFPLILATLLTQLSSCGHEDCQIARDSVEVVTSCPKSKEEWVVAARKKNCNKLSSEKQCTNDKEQYVYHCVINGFRNETLEVCAPNKIIFGYCTEFNVAGGVIQRHASAKCSDTFPKCDVSYNSTEAYKYPDCYKLVYTKQDSKTTPPSSDEWTTSVKPDQEEKPTDVFIIMPSVVAVICSIAILVFYVRKRHRPTNNINNEEECLGLMEKNIDGATRPIKFVYLKAKHFQHFQYNYKLVQDCEVRLKKGKRDKKKKNSGSKDVMIKVGIVGDFTPDNLELIAKGIGEKNMESVKHKPICKTEPLLCFQNDHQSKQALEMLCRERARYKILIKPEPDDCEITEKADDSIKVVGQNRRQIKETITSYLEKDLDQTLQEWLEETDDTSEIVPEIEAIRKQLMLDTSKYKTASPDENSSDKQFIIPNDVRDHLLRMSGVNGFGIWGYSKFQIFVKRGTDKRILRSELIKMDQNFFEKYKLKIDTRNMIEKQTMQQYSSSSLVYHFGEKSREQSSKFNDQTTQQENNVAFIGDSHAIGLRVHKTMGNVHGFDKIEIKESVSDKHDIEQTTGNKTDYTKKSVFRAYFCIPWDSGSIVFALKKDFDSVSVPIRSELKCLLLFVQCFMVFSKYFLCAL